MKTHLDAELATCSFPVPGPGASQGTLLEARESGRNVRVAVKQEVGALLQAAGAGLPVKRKVKVF